MPQKIGENKNTKSFWGQSGEFEYELGITWYEQIIVNSVWCNNSQSCYILKILG